MSLVVLDSAVASGRANGGARRVGIVGLAVLAAIAWVPTLLRTPLRYRDAPKGLHRGLGAVGVRS